MPKSLIVCCDGTWQTLNQRQPTNVNLIARCVAPRNAAGEAQIVYYDAGVGTAGGLDRLKGGGFGDGLNENIRAAYRFLCMNYEEGDRIYLVGFSRGAYTVRSLAGLLYCSGLLIRRDAHLDDVAFDLYRDIRVKPRSPKAEYFRSETPSPQPNITGLACFDTVGALGIPDMIPGPLDNWFNEEHEFHDHELNPKVEKAFHACALDEIRKNFMLTPMQRHKNREEDQVEQVWFPGDHGSIGGGSKLSEGLSHVACQWMIDRLKSVQLDFDSKIIKAMVHPDPTAPFDNDIRGIYRLGGKAERNAVGQKLHPSVSERQKKDPNYVPAADC